MNTKQLELHPDKAGYIIMGKGEARKKIENDVIENPIKRQVAWRFIP